MEREIKLQQYHHSEAVCLRNLAPHSDARHTSLSGCFRAFKVRPGVVIVRVVGLSLNLDTQT